jgi:hypothetical protein
MTGKQLRRLEKRQRAEQKVATDHEMDALRHSIMTDIIDTTGVGDAFQRVAISGRRAGKSFAAMSAAMNNATAAMNNVSAAMQKAHAGISGIWFDEQTDMDKRDWQLLKEAAVTPEPLEHDPVDPTFGSWG